MSQGTSRVEDNKTSGGKTQNTAQGDLKGGKGEKNSSGMAAKTKPKPHTHPRAASMPHLVGVK